MAWLTASPAVLQRSGELLQRVSQADDAFCTPQCHLSCTQIIAVTATLPIVLHMILSPAAFTLALLWIVMDNLLSHILYEEIHLCHLRRDDNWHSCVMRRKGSERWYLLNEQPKSKTTASLLTSSTIGHYAEDSNPMHCNRNK